MARERRKTEEEHMAGASPDPGQPVVSEFDQLKQLIESSKASLSKELADLSKKVEDLEGDLTKAKTAVTTRLDQTQRAIAVVRKGPRKISAAKQRALDTIQEARDSLRRLEDANEEEAEERVLAASMRVLARRCKKNMKRLKPLAEEDEQAAIELATYTQQLATIEQVRGQQRHAKSPSPAPMYGVMGLGGGYAAGSTLAGLAGVGVAGSAIATGGLSLIGLGAALMIRAAMEPD